IINVTVAGGSGELGRKFVRAFLADGDYRVSVLSRADSQSEALDSLRQQGVSVISVDYNQRDELVQALQGADILVCTLDYVTGMSLQPTLVQAAKAAGVRRFVPSDFADESPELDALYSADTGAIVRIIEEHQLEYTRYFCGMFYCYLATPDVGIDVKNRKATVVGKGDAPLSLVNRDDIARFVAASLKDPRSKNARFGIQSCSTTFRELVATIEKHSGVKLEVSHV
ncbi:hypothetical protein THASP1DRAFT_7935, partial [Thamnocephalis sphaerospora]